jgi:phage gpG-like protein
MRAANEELAMEEVHRYMLEVEKELFDSEGSSGAHGAWEGKQERKGNEGTPILQLSGDLMRSLTEADDPHHMFFVTPTGMGMGTDLPYAEDHQRGTERMPQRRIVDFTPQNREVILGIISSWIVSGGARPIGGVRFIRRAGSGRFT